MLSVPISLLNTVGGPYKSLISNPKNSFDPFIRDTLRGTFIF